jgi:pimeloyl-ACP methyl ester carboxylesterase
VTNWARTLRQRLPMSEPYTDHFFATPDGPRLHYRDYPAVGETRGVPILCLHGLTRNVKDFEELAPWLAALGRRVISVSQRGRGRSDADPQVERYQPLTYAMDMIGLLDQLGLDQVIIIGTSMGGLMTLVIGAHQPQRLVGAVINDIGPEIATEGIVRILNNVTSRSPVQSWDEAAERTRQYNVPAFPDRADDPEFWSNFARKTWIESDDGEIVLDSDPAIVGQLSTDAVTPDLWALWEAFETIPTLLVRGGITDLLTLETVAEMKRRKPDLGYVEVAGVGHAPFMTEADTWPTIKKFVSELD